MHILMLPSWYPETADSLQGSFFREQAEALGRAGDRVGVLAVRGFPIYQAGSYRARPDTPRRSVEQGVTVVRGNVLLPLPKAHRLNTRAIERVWRRAFDRYVLDHGTPDVLHAHAMFPAGVVAARISESTGIPLVITEHRPSFADRARSGAWGRMARASADTAARLVAVSPGFAEALNASYGRDDWTFEAGLLAPAFEAAEARTPPSGHFVFGHVSHLDPGKRVDLLIEAFAEAFGDDPDVRLRIVGGSEHLPALRALAAERRLANVDFVGAVARDRVADELAQMHALVLPSEAESFGTVFWEALAVGVPLISTATWGGAWAITPETGLLVPIGDGKRLAAALVEMRGRCADYDPAALRELSLATCGEAAFVRRSHALYTAAIEGTVAAEGQERGRAGTATLPGNANGARSSAARPRMIYHVPYPLDPNATSASGIRPVRMREAFEAIGYEVFEVSGVAAVRRRRIREAKRRIRAGERFDLVYSEASTKPTAMTESHSLPTHPWLDLNFLRFCTKRGIPVGVFYRDIYWNSPKYLETVPKPIAMITRRLYRSDLRRYRTAVKRIFLPSMRMAGVMPLTRIDQCVALPPASPTVDSPVPELDPPQDDQPQVDPARVDPAQVDPLRHDPPRHGMSLLYVGGTGSYYRMQQTVAGVEACPGARLTICTREGEWNAARAAYADVLGPSTTVVHRSGDELEALYADAHIGVLMMEPIGYREFAAPMKLYEYLGHGKPIIATEGSLAADFVTAHGVGWALPYRAEALAELLERLQRHPEEYVAVRDRVLEVREEHTWEARARQAAEALGATS
ncbi:MAG: glycosyltransferase [Leucobacter sp.]